MSRMIKRMSKRRSFLSNQILPSHLLLLQQSLHNHNPCHCPPGMTDTDDQRSLMILSLPRYRLSQQSQPSHQDAGMMQLDVPTSHQPVQGQALGQKLKNSYSKFRFRYYIRQSKYSLLSCILGTRRHLNIKLVAFLLAVAKYLHFTH